MIMVAARAKGAQMMERERVIVDVFGRWYYEPLATHGRTPK